VKLGELIGHPFISINGAAIEPEQPEPEAET